MKLKITPDITQSILKAVLFLGIILIISYLLPNKNKFKYQFENGKPWSYDMIVSPFDFPVYKSETQLQIEKKALLEGFIPYFRLDTSIINNQFQKFQTEYLEKAGEFPVDVNEIRTIWNNVYAKGVISNDHLKMLLENKNVKINCILPNKETSEIDIKSLNTPKTAYQEFMNFAPIGARSLNINLYLIENLKYDSIISELSKDELLKNLSLTSGIVQAGEKIIDRGEVVNDESFLILNSMKIAFEKNNTGSQRSILVVFGEIIIITGLILLFFLYLNLFRPRIFISLKSLIFINLLILTMISLASLTIRYSSVSYFILPYALLPIMVRVFFDSRTALFAHLISTLIISLVVDNAFQFVLIQVAVGMTAVSSLKDMTQRSQLAQTALIIFLTYALTFLALEFISEGELSRVHWQSLIYFAISSGFLLFAYLLIYIFEKLFNEISSITLLELTNVNSDLMMQFAEKAPGTFQHTLQVSNLATEAAKKIGANSLLVRTGALYHDIGKMKNPHYFIENQLGGPNPLTELTFEDAAKRIINHVKDGIEIAKKEHLPEQIIHFIGTHHGLSKTKYFYNSFINANPDQLPDDSIYTYPGPLPDTKETAIMMMADAVEARARSLKVYTEESINDCVESMINSQIADGQFKDAPISFRDVESVKEIFKEKIKNMYHNRIVYPELTKK